jgi:tetratricopeptide (TPR) repeat protein
MAPTNPLSDPSARRDRTRWSLAIFVFALLVRAIEVWELSGSALAEMVMGDGRNYVAWAHQVAGGAWLGTEVFYQAPLYPYFLGVVFALLGDDLLVVRVVQITLGAASCVLLTRAGWRFLSRPVGIAAGVLLAIYAPVIFADATIQKSVLDVFFVCLTLWILSGIDARPALSRCAALGASIGALVLSRENALVFPLVLLPWLFLHVRSSRRRRLACIALFTVGIGGVLLPVALRNAYVGGEFHLTTSQFGHNFYIGNNEVADSTYAPLLRGRGDPRIERQDAIDLAERALGRELTPAEVSSYYTRRALRYIRSHPGDWIALMGRKLALTFNALEWVDTKGQYAHAELSSVLRLSGWLFHFGVLAPLALLGVWITWSDRARLRPLYLLFVAYSGTLLMFYVFARYRLPLVPILALFAAASIVRLPEFVRTGRPLRIAASLAVVAAAAVLCNWPISDKSYMRSVTHYNLGNELAAVDRIDEAMEHYRTAIRVYAGNARANHNLGSLLAQRGELDRARAHFERALRIDPDYVEAHFNLARALRESGDTSGAIARYRRGLRMARERADMHTELGHVYRERGETARAIASFERALEIAPDLATARQGLLLARKAQDGSNASTPRSRP